MRTNEWFEGRDEGIEVDRLGVLADQFQEQLSAIPGVGLDSVERQTESTSVLTAALNVKKPEQNPTDLGCTRLDP